MTSATTAVAALCSAGVKQGKIFLQNITAGFTHFVLQRIVFQVFLLLRRGRAVQEEVQEGTEESNM